jgi:hypothetical protein
MSVEVTFEVDEPHVEVIPPIAEDPTADDDGLEARERAHRLSEVLAGETHE